jgi:MarR family transcriptional regulator, organic hydroperoxide resistance regulator
LPPATSLDLTRPTVRPQPAAGVGGTAPAPDPVEAAQVLRQFRIVFGAVRRHFRRIEKQAGIGGASIWALSLIARQPGLGVSQLAALMDIHQSTVSNLLRNMMREGLVQMERASHDRRHVQLHALPAGLKLLGRVRGPYAGVLPDALARLDPATLGRLQHDLAVLIATMDVDASAAQTPLSML